MCLVNVLVDGLTGISCTSNGKSNTFRSIMGR